MASYTTLLLLMAFVGYTAAETCGTSGRSCIVDKSSCVGNLCVCNAPYVWGDGFFQCYRQNQVASESRNDPSFTTFNNETVEFPFPCRYLLTHVRQELKDQSRNVIGHCEFQIYAFNKRFRGKVATHGFDIAAKIIYDDETVVERSVRKYGTASNGVPTFTVNGVHSYVPNGDWTPSVSVDYIDAANNIKIQCFEEPDNNQIVYEFKACGLEVTFVPYDIENRRDQVEIPGISVGINCAHHPVWLSNGEVIGLAPHWQGGQLLNQIVVGDLTESQSLVDRAFRNSDAAQNQPDAHPKCEDAADILGSCTEAQRNDAYASCFWMLHEARFVRCVHNNGMDYVDLFVRCVDSKCGTPNPAECNNVKNEIGAACTLSGISKLTDFLSGSLC